MEGDQVLSTDLVKGQVPELGLKQFCTQLPADPSDKKDLALGAVSYLIPGLPRSKNHDDSPRVGALNGPTGSMCTIMTIL